MLGKKKVLLTGGSKGLGKAIKLLLEKDYQVQDVSRSTGWDLSQQGMSVQGIDILILNAGSWKNNWKLNYETPKMMADQMSKTNLVIFVLSNAAYQSYGNDDYTAAKSGLLHYARRKQNEGFMFSTISPGAMDCDNFWKEAEIDHRKKGCMKPEDVAESIKHIITQAEKGVLIRELVIKNV